MDCDRIYNLVVVAEVSLDKVKRDFLVGNQSVRSGCVRVTLGGVGVGLSTSV